jgi:hypothetical protein
LGGVLPSRVSKTVAEKLDLRARRAFEIWCKSCVLSRSKEITVYLVAVIVLQIL